MKTVNIKGKEYVEVNERVKYFREKYKGWSIENEMISNVDGVCVFRSVVKDENGVVKATGHAYEKEKSSFINQTSYIENCETSAVGRALGFLGIGIDASIASSDEVLNAINNQNAAPATATATVPDGRLDFDKLKDWLEPMTTIEEVEAAREKTMKKYPNMTDKQKHAVNRIFATKKDNIEDPNGELIPGKWGETKEYQGKERA